MSWNDAYWNNKENRKKQAKEHHELMAKIKADEIAQSVMATTTYSLKAPYIKPHTGSPESVVVNQDTVSAIFSHGTGDDRTIALNFASYKNPGGGFLAGSSAQEESLCMESTLFEVLSSQHLKEFYDWNNQNKNRSLYKNRALLSPGIIFERQGKGVKAAILTVASPNRKAYMDYINGANEPENLESLRSRIKFIADIIDLQNAEVAILGAFGCGVFGQDPAVVAELFKESMANTSVKKIVYAVIDKGGHSKEGAYAIFKRIMS